MDSSNDETTSSTTVDIESVSSTSESEWVNNHEDLVDVNLEDEDDISEYSDIETGPSNDEPKNQEIARELQSRLDLLIALHDSHEIDPRLGHHARCFAFARSERAKISKPPILASLIETSCHIADIRADMQWASDAAWRRKNRQPYVRWSDFEIMRKKKDWKRPYLTYLILISHFVTMLYEFYLSNWTPVSMKENPMFGPSGDILLKAGGMKPSDMIKNGSWFQLVTATFLHSGVIHFLLNDLFIYLLASIIEMNHGMTCLALVYFLPAVAAFVLTAIFKPGSIVVGASGGLFALMGACTADVIVNWKLMFLVFEDHPFIRRRCLQLRCAVLMFIEIALQVGFGFFVPMVDNYAHVGGLVYGFLVAYVILERLPLAFFGRERGCFGRCFSVMLRFAAATTVSSAIAFSAVKLSQSDGVTIPYPFLNQIMDNPFEI